MVCLLGQWAWDALSTVRSHYRILLYAMCIWRHVSCEWIQPKWIHKHKRRMKKAIPHSLYIGNLLQISTAIQRWFYLRVVCVVCMYIYVRMCISLESHYYHIVVVVQFYNFEFYAFGTVWSKHFHTHLPIR